MSKKNSSFKKEWGEVDIFARNALEGWEQVGTPIRPSQEEIDFYMNHVESFSDGYNSKILILGATPELRDIALKYGKNRVGCDIDDRIWEVMKIFMKESGKEKFIHSDWLTMPEDEKFDIILGDCSVNMLPSDSVEPFIQKTARLVQDKGMVIQRIGTSFKKYTVEDFAKAMEDYRTNQYPMSIWRFTVMLACSINSYYYPEHTHLKIYEKELFKYLTEDEIQGVRPFLPDRIIYFPEKQSLEETFNKYFEVDEIVESKGMGYWSTMYTYVMRKRK